jgi:hypothetical protein
MDTPDYLTPTKQAAWQRLSDAEAELDAARWNVIGTTNRATAERKRAGDGRAIGRRANGAAQMTTSTLQLTKHA